MRYDSCGQMRNLTCHDCEQHVAHEDDGVLLDSGFFVCHECARCAECGDDDVDNLTFEWGLSHRAVLCKQCAHDLELED